MKKNKMLRLASVLLVMTLLTTSIIGGTFAKYTTTGSVSDTARVAKWGVEIKTSGTLYSDAYAKQGNLPAAWTEDKNTLNDNISVAAATKGDNIVAPGTKSYGNGLSFDITGKPEVAVEVKTTIEAEDIYLKKGTYGVLVLATVSDTESLKKVVNENKDGGVYKSDASAYSKVSMADTYAPGTQYYILTNKVELDKDYFPVEYTLEGSTGNTDLDAKTAVAIAEKLAKMVDSKASAAPTADYKVSYENISHQFDANTDLSTAGPKFKNEKLTWEWKFEGTGNEDRDSADTILGDLIAARGASVDYKFVSVDDATTGTVTELTFGTDKDFTVKKGADIVANLQTKFDIKLDVTQID